MTSSPPTGPAPFRRWILTGVAVTMAAAAAWLFASRVANKMPDLDVYLTAGARAGEAAPLYQAEDGHYQFKYLPAFAVLMTPLSALPVPAARAVWFSASLALLALLLAGAARVVAEGRDASTHREKPVWLVVALTVAVLAKFYAHELVLGQVNIPFAVVVVAALLAIRAGREGWAGVCVVLAIVLKPYGVLFVPWLLMRRRMRSILSVAVGAVLVIALPVLRYGVAGTMSLHEAWWHTVVTTTAPNVLNPDNVSWLAMLTRWTGEPGGRWIPALLLCMTAGFAGAMAWAWARRASVPCPEPLEASMLLAVIPFLSPQGWDYVLLIATPAVMLLVVHEWRLPAIVRGLTWTALVIIALTLYDLMGRARYHAFMNASGITICFLVLMAALLTLRQRRAA